MITTEQALQVQGESLATEAIGLLVTDQPSFELAGVMLQTVKGYLKKVGEVFDPIIRKAHETHHLSLEQKKKLEEPALRAERAIKMTMGTYEQAQDRLRRDAEALAEKERQRLADEAKLAAALEAEARGDDRGAERILAAPFTPTPIIVPVVQGPPPPKAEGVSFRSQYRAEVTDLALLVKAVAGGEAPVSTLQANLTALNGLARAMKEELRIPGVRVIVERVAAVRT